MGDITCQVNSTQRVVSAGVVSAGRTVSVSVVPAVPAAIALSVVQSQKSVVLSMVSKVAFGAFIAGTATLLNPKTISFADGGNIAFGLSGSTVTAAGSLAQSVQTQNSVLVLGSSGDVSFGNANGIIFGGNANTITASHDGLTTAAQSDHSHGNPTLALTNLSGTTASNSGGLTVSLSVARQTGVSAIQAGTTSMSSGTLSFSNLNGVSFGLNGNTITGSHNGLTTAMASNAGTGFMSTSERANYFYTSNNTLANSTHSHGAIAVTGINATTNSSGLSLSVPSQSVQTQNSVQVLGSSGNISFANSYGITFGGNANTITASHNALTTAAQSNHSHGNPSLALTNVGGTTASNSAGLTLSLSAAAQSVQTQGSISIQGSSGNISFGNANGITFGGNASTITASHNALTTAAQSNHSHGNPSLNLTNISGTTASNSAGLTLSLSAGGGGGVGISAGTQSVSTGTMVFANSNGVSFGMSGSNQITAIHNGLTTAALSNHSHGNPTLNLTNLSGTTASNSAGLTISLSAAAPGAGGAIAVSAGTTSNYLQSLTFSNSNGITFGLNGDIITASAAGGGGGLAVSAGTTSSALQTMVFSNGNGVTFGLNGNTITASAAAGGTDGGAAARTVTFCNPQAGLPVATIQIISPAMGFVRFGNTDYVHCNAIAPYFALTFNTTTGAGSQSITVFAGLYSQVNSSDFSLLGSASQSMAMSRSSGSATFSYCYSADSTGGQSHTTTGFTTSGDAWAKVGGNVVPRFLSLVFSNQLTLTPQGPYFVGIACRFATMGWSQGISPYLLGGQIQTADFRTLNESYWSWPNNALQNIFTDNFAAGLVSSGVTNYGGSCMPDTLYKSNVNFGTTCVIRAIAWLTT